MDKKILKDNIGYFVVFISLFILTVALYIISFYGIRLEEIIILVAVYIISIVYFFVLKDIDKKQIKIEKIFLMLAIPMGLLYLLAFPIGTIPDEENHLMRVYEISLGYPISEKNSENIGGRILPSNLKEVAFRWQEENISTWFERASKAEITEEQEFIEFSNTSLYSFICYLPQALGIFIARIFTKNILFMAYFARLFNFSTFIILTYYGIKLLPTKKLMALIIATLPLTFQEGVSLSPDALIIAISMFFIGYVFYLKDSEIVLNKKNYCILIFSSIVISLCKIIYFPMVLLVCLLPEKQFGTKKRKYIFTISLILFTLAINFLWTIFATRYVIKLDDYVDLEKQIAYILSQPITFIITCLRTFDLNTTMYVNNILSDLSMFNVILSGIFKYILLAILVLFMFCNSEKDQKIDNFTKIIIAIVIICVIGLMATSLYVQWSPYKFKYVSGIQGRYFLPIMILLPIVFNNNYFVIDKKISHRMLASFILFISLHAITSIIIFYK